MNRGSDGEVSGSQVKSVMMNTFFKSKKKMGGQPKLLS
jgi:hypothetical protein